MYQNNINYSPKVSSVNKCEEFSLFVLIQANECETPD